MDQGPVQRVRRGTLPDASGAEAAPGPCKRPSSLAKSHKTRVPGRAVRLRRATRPETPGSCPTEDHAIADVSGRGAVLPLRQGRSDRRDHPIRRERRFEHAGPGGIPRLPRTDRSPNPDCRVSSHCRHRARGCRTASGSLPLVEPARPEGRGPDIDPSFPYPSPAAPPKRRRLPSRPADESPARFRERRPARAGSAFHKVRRNPKTRLAPWRQSFGRSRVSVPDINSGPMLAKPAGLSPIGPET